VREGVSMNHHRSNGDGRATNRPASICLVALLTLAGAHTTVAQAPARDSLKRAALAGVVRDSTARIIQGAIVSLIESGLATTTDDSGRFHLAGIPAGIHAFSVRRVGYQPMAFDATLAGDSTLVITVTLRSVALLPDVTVKARALSERLARTGFYHRRGYGIGSFVAPERIDSLAHVSTPSQLLRDVRGIELVCGKIQCAVKTRTGAACLSLFVNGAFVVGQMDDVLTTNEIAAIEVYQRASYVPIEFQSRLPRKSSHLTAQAGCGAIVVWTKSRAASPD
jgi:hypothetical protein